MLGKERAARLAVSVVTAAILSGGSAWAVSGGLNGHPSGNPHHTTPTSTPCKAGWGYGDKNHCHAGPPGLNRSHRSGPKP